jgi:hypothetical protein
MARLLRTVSQPWSATRVGDELLEAFNEPFTRLSASLGFVNGSGVRHIADALTGFRGRGGSARFVVGVDGNVTSAAGVRALHRLADEVWVFRNPARPLFHPKTYVFDSETTARAIIGSANLTESALWVNYEDAAVIEFDLEEPADRTELGGLLSLFADAVGSTNALQATDELIDQLEESGLLPSEARRRQRDQQQRNEVSRKAADQGVGVFFPPAGTGSPPAAPLLPEEQADVTSNPPPPPFGSTGTQPPVVPAASPHRLFVLRLGHRDAGTRAGYSPDVFIPLAALNADPGFWRRDALLQHIVEEGHDYEERYALVEFQRRNGDVELHERRLYLYPGRAEFRFNTSEIHSDSDEGDLMVVEIAPAGVGYEYSARVLKPTDSGFAALDAVAAETVRNSDKRWGYA